MEVVHPAGWLAVPQQIPRQWGHFELRWQDAPSTTRDQAGSTNDRMRTTQRIGVRPWITGSLTTPSMHVALVAPDASQSISLSVEGALVQVRSVLPPGETLPRDIRPQAMVAPASSPWNKLVGLAMLALAAVAVLVSRRLAEQRRQTSVAPAPPPMPPLEAAMAELDLLLSEGLPAKGRFKEFYERASDSLRRYISDALNVDALDSTRRELDHQLHTFGLPDGLRRDVDQGLAESDLVKFARLRPVEADADAFLPRISTLIHALDAWHAPEQADEDGATS